MGGRVNVSLACSLCGSRNYKTSRTLKLGDKLLELKKFCKTCNQHTVHRESK